jgi:hypothetical protein
VEVLPEENVVWLSEFSEILRELRRKAIAEMRIPHATEEG